MRTGLFLLAGVLLLGASFMLAKLFSSNYPSAPLVAFVIFAAFWFVVTAFNMWVGVSKAGYSIGEELPIFLLLYGVPAILAGVIKWKVM
jgi:hypothetical protein